MPEVIAKHTRDSTRGGALAGLSVVEVGEMVAAPYCAKLLADLGANVVKVETPGGGDPARLRGPFPDDEPHPERSALFLYLNTSKRGITLDLAAEEGRALFRKLVSRVDILIEDRTPGELEALGLGYADLAAHNPRLIVTSITPFGQTGPNRAHKTHHLNLFHSAGHTSPFGAKDPKASRAPSRAGGYLGEYDAGLTAALGTLGAVFGRELTGRGQHIDASKQEAMMCLERVTNGRFANEPDPFSGRGPGGLTRAKDGYVMVTTLEQHQWEGLIRAMGTPEWSKGEWCRDMAARMENADEIAEHVEAWAADLTRDEIYHLVQAQGTPAGPVRNVVEVKAWEQANARGFFQELDHPEVGRQSYPTAPYLFSKTPWVGHAAPLIGEHNEEVYGETLGCTAGDLANLSREGAI